MAVIEKRAGSDGTVSYRVKVRIKGFAPETATFERKTDAKDWATEIEADMKAGRHFGQSKRHTLKDLIGKYVEGPLQALKKKPSRRGLSAGLPVMVKVTRRPYARCRRTGV